MIVSVGGFVSRAAWAGSTMSWSMCAIVGCFISVVCCHSWMVAILRSAHSRAVGGLTELSQAAAILTLFVVRLSAWTKLAPEMQIVFFRSSLSVGFAFYSFAADR